MDREKIIKEIEELISYGDSLEISKEILKYLDTQELISIREKLQQRVNTLKDEDKEWLERFKKYD